jgi:2-iminobutanoate/2-iminopropanoate deaminase
MSTLYTKFCQILLPVVLLTTGLSVISDAADPLLREYYTDELGTARAYSRAVVTEGGRTVWLAGQLTLEDAEGNSIAGDFAAQVREDFRLIETHLGEFGGDLQDIVTMTVYVADIRNAEKYLAAKKEIFGDGPYPSSALIGVSGFSRPGVEVEVKAVAVVGD